MHATRDSLAVRDDKEKAMHALLANILDAHGGLDRWKAYARVEATMVSGGGFLPLKGVPQEALSSC